MSNLPIIPTDKIQLIKDQICKGASDQELEMFIMNCNRTGLDPLQKQCWAVKRWDSSIGREVMTFQTGVDGFRVIANRSEKYAGQLGPFWCGDDGMWKDVWIDPKPPIAAKVAVLRSDFKEPLWAVAKFSSYAAKKKDGSLTPFWSKMPELMIAKVAESLALRKAFPQDLSGVYSQEEMEQAEIKDVTDPKKLPPQVVQTKVEVPAHGASETVNSPVEVVSPKPILNHAPQNNKLFESYKTRFEWGSFPMGLSFAKLGKKDTENLIKGIMSWKLKKLEENAEYKIPQQFEEFLTLANQYLVGLK